MTKVPADQHRHLEVQRLSLELEVACAPPRIQMTRFVTPLVFVPLTLVGNPLTAPAIKQ